MRENKKADLPGQKVRTRPRPVSGNGSETLIEDSCSTPRVRARARGWVVVNDHLASCQNGS
jgi:hypothetical protein